MEKYGLEENAQGQEQDGGRVSKANQATNFLNSLGTDNGFEQKNLLLEVMNRELVNKGNYLNIDGQCLSVKKFLRDWNTDNLYRTLQSTNDFDYINKFQS